MDHLKRTNNLEQKMTLKVNSQKGEISDNSLISSFSQHQNSVIPREQHILQNNVKNIQKILEQQLQVNDTAQDQIFRRLQQILILKVEPISNTLNAIQHKVNGMNSKVQVRMELGETSSICQKSLSHSIDQSISAAKNTLSLSINYYNNQLSQRQKSFNKEHQETSRIVLQSYKGLTQIKTKAGEIDFKKLEQTVNVLLRSQNKYEDILRHIDKQVSEVQNKNDKLSSKNILRNNCNSQKDFCLVQVSQQELLQMILQNYQLDIASAQL